MIPTWLAELNEAWDEWIEHGPALQQVSAFFGDHGFIIIKPTDPVIDQVLEDDPDSEYVDNYVRACSSPEGAIGVTLTPSPDDWRWATLTYLEPQHD